MAIKKKIKFNFLKYFFITSLLFTVIIFLSIVNSNSGELCNFQGDVNPTKDSYVKTKSLVLEEIIYLKDFSSYQGIFVDDDDIYITGGYNKFNAVKLSNKINLKARLGKKNGKSELIASVAKYNKNVAWTGYRNNQIFITDDNLNLIFVFSQFKNKQNLVGLTFLSEDKLLVLNRSSNRGLKIIDLKNNKSKLLKISKNIKEIYDIEVYKNCVFISSRNAGIIYSGKLNDLDKKKKLSLSIAYENLHRPQHMQIFNENLFVLETDKSTITKINLHSNEITKFKLPIKTTCRGLAISRNNFYTSCFFRGKGKRSERDTALFVWRE